MLSVTEKVRELRKALAACIATLNDLREHDISLMCEDQNDACRLEAKIVRSVADANKIMHATNGKGYV